MTRLYPAHISEVLQQAVNARLIDDANPWLVFHNLDMFREKLQAIRAVFPSNSLHTLAIKANPLLGVLRIAVEEKFGLEAASFEEVQLALAAGCPPEQIFFDSPAKTRVELAQALKLGISISADNFEELHRIDQLFMPGCRSRVGLRVNPEVGTGRILQTSVATSGSKFGVPINANINAILSAFKQYPWLNGVHFHVGSQGCDLSLMLSAAKRMADLIEAISSQSGSERVAWVNIGGGIPAAYTDDAPTFDFVGYAEGLRKITPALYADQRILVTEFGRAVQANCGWAASRIEYVKHNSDAILAIAHFGADFLMRAVYAPQDWPHEFMLCTAEGKLKQGPLSQVAIAGPLCFAGDIPGRSVNMPEPSIQDLVVVRDAGAYTLSLWSRHCNRAIPMVIGYSKYSKEYDGYQFNMLRPRELPADIVSQWSNKVQN